MVERTRRRGALRDPEVVQVKIDPDDAGPGMAETIDEIEGVLRRRRQLFEVRLDLFRRVRERPVEALGIVFGAGILLGLLGGFEEGGAKRTDLAAEGDVGPQSLRWERRARRLRRVAREQEVELARLRAAARSEEHEELEDELEPTEDDLIGAEGDFDEEEQVGEIEPPERVGRVIIDEEDDALGLRRLFARGRVR